MAGINKYMKPANQPLLDTYVPLPFKEMSMAYAVKQKEHTDAETLAGTLDDDLLKVRASTPLHSKELGNIRNTLDTELKELVDKHGGRYADMVPELNKIKTDLDRDFRDGSLYSIQETTKLKGKLDKDIVKSENKTTYSDMYSPKLGAEREFTQFHNLGLVQDAEGKTTWSTDPDAGWTTTGDGRRILDVYEYTGVHQGAEQTKIANEQTFDKVKPDIKSYQDETKEGKMTKSELKQVSLSKIYRAAYNDHTSYPDDFQQELDLIVTEMMTPEGVLESATNAINNVFGAVPATPELAAARDEALEGLGTVENPAAGAYTWAKTAYVGAIGEKYIMTDSLYSETFTGTKPGSGFGAIPKSDWVPIVEGTTPAIQAGKPMTQDGSGYISESDTPLYEYSKVIDSKRTNLIDIKDEYDGLVNSGMEMDDAYKAEWDEKISNAQYQYESSAFALGNLLQNSAKRINAKRVGDVITFTNSNPMKGVGGVNLEGPEGKVTVGSTEWNSGGWSTIQWDENGLPYDPENVDYKQSMKLRGPSSYASINHGVANGINSLAQSSGKGILGRAALAQSQTMGTDGFFSGRTKALPLTNTSTSLEMDEALDESLATIVTKEDFEFMSSGGTTVTLKNLLNGIEDKGDQKSITQETFDNMGELIKTAQWTMVPDPKTGGYLGMVSVPLDDDRGFFESDVDNASMNLYFPAPKEYHETMRRQGEFEEVLDASLGTRHKITRPRTAIETAKFDDMFNAQLDVARASEVPGDIAMSSFEDGEGSPLGYYYFAQDPNGEPITYEQYVFQPRAGLVSDVTADGTTIFTTGNELYNVDSDLGGLGYLIAMNDPTQSASRDFWLQQAQAPSAPIAVENTILETTSVGLGTDMGGSPFQTDLRPGQTMLVNDRVTAEFGTMNDMPTQFIGLQKPMAGLLKASSDSYSAEFETTINDKLDQNAEGLAVTLNDGSTISLQDAVSGGYLTLEPRNQVNAKDNNFTLNIASGPRTYQGQLDKYDAWIAGGKKGPQVANPAQGGFHVMGQAIDLSHTKSDYDWVLSTTEGIQSIGSSRVTNQGIQTASGAQSGKGVALSELKMLDGKHVMPDFYNQSLTSLLSNITKQPAKIGVIGEAITRDYNIPTDQGIKQFDKEWWHLSYGELTKQPGATYVYPSWAN